MVNNLAEEAWELFAGDGEYGGDGMGVTETGGGTPYDVYATGSQTGPRAPRIASFNDKPGQKVDFTPGPDGIINEGEGGASTFELPEQLQTRGRVWVLPEGSEIPGFTLDRDGRPYGPRAVGHNSLGTNMPMTPHQLVDAFLRLPWQLYMQNGSQLNIK